MVVYLYISPDFSQSLLPKSSAANGEAAGVMAAEESTNKIIMDTTGAEFIPVAMQKVAITGCIKRPITKLLHTFVKITVRIMIITANAEAGTF